MTPTPPANCGWGMSIAGFVVCNAEKQSSTPESLVVEACYTPLPLLHPRRAACLHCLSPIHWYPPSTRPRRIPTQPPTSCCSAPLLCLALSSPYFPHYHRFFFSLFSVLLGPRGHIQHGYFTVSSPAVHGSRVPTCRRVKVQVGPSLCTTVRARTGPNTAILTATGLLKYMQTHPASGGGRVLLSTLFTTCPKRRRWPRLSFTAPNPADSSTLDVL